MHRQSSGWFILAASRPRFVTIHGSMIATTMKSTCLVGVLVIIVCLTESRAYVSFDLVNPDNSSVSDDDLLKSTAPGQQGDVSTEKPKVIHLPLEPRRTRHAIEDNGLIRDTNTNFKRHDSEHVFQTTESIVDLLQKPMHKMHKKKSNMSKKSKMLKKTRRSVNNVARQQLTENMNRSEEYYAQRKAIMDRFRARHREIARKYQQTTTTTTEGPFRYNLGFERLSTTTENHRFQFAATSQPPKVVRSPLTLQAVSPPERSKFHVREGKRRAFSDDHDEPGHATTTLAPTKAPDHDQPTDKDFWEVGECDALENLTMFFEDNLLVRISEGMAVDVEMMASSQQDYCIVCATVKRYSGKVKSTPKIESRKLVVKVESSKDTLVSLGVKFYTDHKKDGHC